MQKSTSWSPLHFLAALGAGGMSVTFFMFLIFWTPHPGRSIPVFEDLMAYASTGGTIAQVVVYGTMLVIGWMIIKHFQLMWWNWRQYSMAKADGRIDKMLGTNAHTQLLAMPLATAMSVNALFIAGALFVPGLWANVEYLLPLALVAFLIIGVWALRLYFDFVAQVFHKKSFNKGLNNSLAQMLPAFAFGMVAVGFSATAIFSHNPAVVTVAMGLSIFFLVATAIIGTLKMIMGFNDLFEHGASPMSLPTLWVLIPILTVSGIAVLRLDHGISHTLLKVEPSSNLVFLTSVFAIQIFIALMGYAVMRRMHYFRDLFSSQANTVNQSPVAFALVCPGVALSVMGQFFINKALVSSGLLVKFGIVYFGLTAIVLVVQLATLWLMFKLIRRQISGPVETVKVQQAKAA